MDVLNKWSYEGIVDQTSMILMELIQLSQNRKVMVDGIFHPAEMKKLAADRHVAYLFAEPELLRRVYFDRDHTQSMLDAIKATSQPDKVLDNVLNSIVNSSSTELQMAIDAGYPYYVRNASTGHEEIQEFLERHLDFQTT